MKKMLKVAFVDFEAGFDPKENWLVDLLSQRYRICLADAPDYLFFSNYGHRYLDYSCPRIFVSCENVRVCGWKADFIFESGHPEVDFRFRLPYYRMRYTQEALETARDWRKIACEPREFASVVISNPMGSERNQFWDCLSKYGPVASGGHYRNNVGGPVSDKIGFCGKYRFCIAFENSSGRGYVTEKLVDAWMAGCVPIYWGDETVSRDFNPKAFIHARDFKSWEDLAVYVYEVNQDQEAYLAYLKEPLLKKGTLAGQLTDIAILDAMERAFQYGHRIPLTLKQAQKSLKGVLKFRRQIRKLLRRDWYR